MFIMLLFYLVTFLDATANNNLDSLLNQVRADTPLVQSQLRMLAYAHENDGHRVHTAVHGEFIKSILVVYKPPLFHLRIEYFDSETTPAIHPALSGQIIELHPHNKSLLPSRVNNEQKIYGYICRLRTPQSDWQFAQIPYETQKLTAAPILQYPFNLCF